VSWKLSRTVLRGGTNSNVGPLLDQWLACVQAAALSCPSFAFSSWMRSCLASYSYRSTSVRPTKVSRSRASTCFSISARSLARICSRSSTGRTGGRSGGPFHTQTAISSMSNRAVMFDTVHTVFPEYLLLGKLTALGWPTPTIYRCLRHSTHRLHLPNLFY